MIYLAARVELAYQQFIAEYSFYCGNVRLVQQANFTSPIYLSLIERFIFSFLS